MMTMSMDMDWNSSLFVGRMWHHRLGKEEEDEEVGTAAEGQSSKSHLHSKSQSHAFSYPLFIFAIDLAEVDEPHSPLFANVLWPLSLLLNFNEKDHLKNNGEQGILMASETETKAVSSSSSSFQQSQQSQPKKSLSERIYALIAQRTQNKFQPTAASHSIVLVTHLSYYGYCFNPVSFYYILSKQQPQQRQPQTQTQQDDDDNHSASSIPSTRLAAIVAEVSNTPWNEMYPYVLHPDSVDGVQVKYSTTPTTSTDDDDDEHDSGATNNSNNNNNNKNTVITTNYVFRKRFHVSPFMEMQYYYDWQFDDGIIRHHHHNADALSSSLSQSDSTMIANAATTTTTTTTTPDADGNNNKNNNNGRPKSRRRRRIHVVTNMRKIRHNENGQVFSGELKFRGGMKVEEVISSSQSCSSPSSSSSSNSIFHNPCLLAWHALMRYPIYCLIIQVWIHYQAFILFYKGVTFQPHPNGSETAASRIIGGFMTPFFALQEYACSKYQSSNTKDSSLPHDRSSKKSD
jgi:DUF1365 family protein